MSSSGQGSASAVVAEPSEVEPQMELAVEEYVRGVDAPARRRLRRRMVKDPLCRPAIADAIARSAALLAAAACGRDQDFDGALEKALAWARGAGADGLEVALFYLANADSVAFQSRRDCYFDRCARAAAGIERIILGEPTEAPPKRSPPIRL